MWRSLLSTISTSWDVPCLALTLNAFQITRWALFIKTEKNFPYEFLISPVQETIASLVRLFLHMQQPLTLKIILYFAFLVFIMKYSQIVKYPTNSIESWTIFSHFVDQFQPILFRTLHVLSPCIRGYWEDFLTSLSPFMLAIVCTPCLPLSVWEVSCTGWNSEQVHSTTIFTNHIKTLCRAGLMK